MNRHTNKLGKKSRKKINLKKLNNAVKGLLEQEKQSKETPKFSKTKVLPINTNSDVKDETDSNNSSSIPKEPSPIVTKIKSRTLPWSRKDLIDLDPESGSDVEIDEKSPLSDQDAELHQEAKETVNKHGVIYTMSKENKLIPKFTDDEIMEKHKQADANMKETWMNIINKYSFNEEDEEYGGVKSDVIDIRTGQIVEDNGHLRSLYKKNKSNGYLDDKNTVRNDKYVSKLLEEYEFDLEKSAKHSSRKHLSKEKVSRDKEIGKQGSHVSQYGSDSSDSSDSDYIDESDVDDSDIWGDEKKDYGFQDKTHLEVGKTTKNGVNKESEYSDSDTDFTE